MPDRYYRIRTDYAATDAQPTHIRDQRGMDELMSDLHSAGYLVSESVFLRHSFMGYKSSPDAETIRTNYFDAKPLGEIALFLSHVIEIAEFVVPPDALPYSD